jgi:hypothetical protein
MKYSTGGKAGGGDGGGGGYEVRRISRESAQLSPRDKNVL